MSLFLLITCITEITGWIIKGHHHPNQWIYNIYLIFEAGFNSLMFGNLLQKYIRATLPVLIGSCLILLCYVIEVFSHGFFIFNDITATVMSVIFVFYSFLYYYLLIRDDRYIDLKHDESFWWVAGTLFFYFGSTACNLFYVYLKDVLVNQHNITYIIFAALSVLLYGCWSYSFICRKWLTTLKT